MKNNLLITSFFAIACVLAGGASGYAASSVRVLGGAGTYPSAASATASGVTTASTRGGSVRINPKTTRTTIATAKTPVTRTNGRAATTSRLSIGKYLGVTGAIGGGSSLRTNTGTTTVVNTELQSELRSDVDELQRNAESFQEQLDAKQDKLTAGKYIELDNDQVNVKLDVVANDLSERFAAVTQGAPIEMGTNDDNELLWRFADDTSGTWNVLASPNDIISQIDMSSVIENAIGDTLANYYTKTEVNGLINDINSFIGDADDLETTNHDSIVSAINEVKNSVAIGGADVAALQEQLNELDQDVGDNDDLTTNDKTSVVAAINEVRSYILPTANPVCTSPSNLCVLSINHEGELEWVAVTETPAGYTDENTNTSAQRVATVLP